MRLFIAGSVERILPRFARPRRVKTSNRGAMMYARHEIESIIQNYVRALSGAPAAVRVWLLVQELILIREFKACNRSAAPGKTKLIHATLAAFKTLAHATFLQEHSRFEPHTLLVV